MRANFLGNNLWHKRKSSIVFYFRFFRRKRKLDSSATFGRFIFKKLLSKFLSWEVVVFLPWKSVWELLSPDSITRLMIYYDHWWQHFRNKFQSSCLNQSCGICSGISCLPGKVTTYVVHFRNDCLIHQKLWVRQKRYQNTPNSIPVLLSCILETLTLNLRKLWIVWFPAMLTCEEKFSFLIKTQTAHARFGRALVEIYLMHIESKDI